MAAWPREPRSLLRGPCRRCAASHAAPCAREPRCGAGGAETPRAGALEAPRLPPRESSLRPAGRAGPGLPFRLREARSRAAAGSGSRPCRALPWGDEAGRAPLVLTLGFFFFLVSRPGNRSRLRLRLGGPGLARGPAPESQAAFRERCRCRERERNFGLRARAGEAGRRWRRAGRTPRWSLSPGSGASPRREATSVPPQPRSRLSVCAPGRWVWIYAFLSFTPAAPGGGPVKEHGLPALDCR